MYTVAYDREERMLLIKANGIVSYKELNDALRMVYTSIDGQLDFIKVDIKHWTPTDLEDCDRFALRMCLTFSKFRVYNLTLIDKNIDLLMTVLDRVNILVLDLEVDSLDSRIATPPRPSVYGLFKNGVDEDRKLGVLIVRSLGLMKFAGYLNLKVFPALTRLELYHGWYPRSLYLGPKLTCLKLFGATPDSLDLTDFNSSMLETLVLNDISYPIAKQLFVNPFSRLQKAIITGVTIDEKMMRRFDYLDSLTELRLSYGMLEKRARTTCLTCLNLRYIHMDNEHVIIKQGTCHHHKIGRYKLSGNKPSKIRKMTNIIGYTTHKPHSQAFLYLPQSVVEVSIDCPKTLFKGTRASKKFYNKVTSLLTRNKIPCMMIEHAVVDEETKGIVYTPGHRIRIK